MEWHGDINDHYGFWAMKFLKAIVVERAITTTLPILKKSEFEKISIPVPPKEYQDQFAQIVNTVSLLHEKFEIYCKESDMLFNSLSERAFRGKL